MIARWLCETCNKKWVYPLNNCFYCKNKVRKQKGTAFRVKGISRVNVPSPFHPVVPYNVLLLEDEFGNKAPKKSMKGYCVGDSFTVPKAKSENAVSIVKIKYDIQDSLHDSIALLDAFPVFDGDSVLIKVDAQEKVAPHHGGATSPHVLEALIGFLHEKKIQDIVVADQSQNDLSLSSERNGILEVCNRKKVPLLNLSHEEFVEKKGFIIPKVVENRKIIVVSPLKTNAFPCVGGAVQSLISLCHPETQKKIEMNPKINLSQFLDVCSPSLVIGDGTVGLERDTQLAGNKPFFLHALLVSKNCAAIDYTFAQLGMLDSPSYIKKLAGTHEVVGEELDAMKRRLA